MGSIIHVAATQHWAGKALSLSNERWLKRAHGAAQKRDRSSIALACRAFEISETEEIADWLERLTANKRSWGFGLCFLYLRNVHGYGWNHKRVYPIGRQAIA